MSQKATLIIDFGNSETRAMVQYGQFTNVNRPSKLLTISNKFVQTNRQEGDLNETSYPSNNTEDSNKESFIFKLDHKLSIGTRHVQQNTLIINGEFAEKNYATLNFGPQGKKAKYNNTHTVYSTITAIYKAAKAIAPELELTVSDILTNFVWDLTVLLPPQQVQNREAIDKLKEDLKAISGVEIVYPTNTDADIKISNVTVQQEGYTAFYGTIFDRRTKRPYPGLANVLQSRSLVLDIGAGTTDVMVVDAGRAISSSEKTINIGGNDVLGKTIKFSGKDNRSSEVFEDAVSTGYIMSSNKKVSVVEAVNQAKIEVSQILVHKLINDYFNETDIDLETIQYLIVVGGGTLDAENPDIENLSQSIIEELRDSAENIELITANEKTYISDELMQKDSLVTPRTVNVIGASILTDIRDLQQQQRK